MTRITLCNWESYQTGSISERTASVGVSVPQASDKRSADVRQASTYNKEKNDKNEKKNTSAEILKFVRAKKGYEELTEEEKQIALECANFYEQALKSKMVRLVPKRQSEPAHHSIDFNKLCILVYGSVEDKEQYGFGDWQTLRKALGYLSREELTHKVLHPYYYIWSLSRQKDFVEKMKKLTSGHCEESR
jgi:hypothetical protein